MMKRIIGPLSLTCLLALASTACSGITETQIPAVDSDSDVTVFADIADVDSYQGELYDIWNTINRISPTNGVVAFDGLKVNTVRMLGGINKKCREVSGLTTRRFLVSARILQGRNLSQLTNVFCCEV